MSGSWWFVENSSFAPEIYEAAYDYAQMAGAEVPATMAAGRCSQLARGSALRSLVNQRLKR